MAKVTPEVVRSFSELVQRLGSEISDCANEESNTLLRLINNDALNDNGIISQNICDIESKITKLNEEWMLIQNDIVKDLELVASTIEKEMMETAKAFNPYDRL